MLILTTKISRKKIIFSSLTFVAILAITVSLLHDTKSVEALNDKTITETAAQREAFLNSFGIKVESSPAEVKEVIIPEEFDEVYERYNEIQKSCGYDLEKYKGERVKLFKFRVIEHPSGENEVYANLLIYKDEVIGGDISSSKIDGFMTGLVVQNELT